VEIHSLFDVLTVTGVICTVVLLKPHNRRRCWYGAALLCVFRSWQFESLQQHSLY